MRSCCRVTISVLLLLCGAACSSVAIPSERHYRLELPPPAGGELPRGGVLRVHDLVLGNALPGDRLAVVQDGVAVQTWELDRWVAPLDRLVTDALVQGLTRTQLFQLVKGAGDTGPEDLVLAGRIVDFSCVQRAGGALQARAALQLWLQHGELVLFQGELVAEVPVAEPGPQAAVRALSLALLQVQDQLVGRLRQEQVFLRPLDATPGR